MKNKLTRRQRIRYRIRKNLRGTADRPRLSVFRSNKEIYAQLIDDLSGVTICAASSRDNDLAGAEGTKSDVAKKVGETLASKATAQGITTCVFDRSGYLYHGRVKSLADGAREGGLKF
ncbi:MAG: 50S ribosomal protein L18 [Bacteroidota bacterium]